ncbi:hypothetical protein HYU07_00170 [Candidatus Woesearchaeota archaeon]|nr:hypothetical protein [Candidatus Woesearchaeota archaeon]
MMKNKKGVDISVNVIIVAALALIVLVVLFAIFTGRLGGFSLAVQSCADKGGTCTNPDSTGKTANCGADSTVLKGTDCEKDNNNDKKADGYCCMPIIKS